jgi:hypothetical protein
LFGIKTRLKKMLRTRRGLRTNHRILSKDYGAARSFWNEQCLDGQGKPVPWFTYPAIEYLNQLDLSHMRVLEFGSGASTLYWARRTKHVVSIEDSKSWYERMKPQLPSNVDYINAPTQEEIVRAATELTSQFDLIINDGVYRYDCAVASRSKLADGGIVIVDNSDWCTKTCAYYRDSDLIEVDMAGFTPLNDYPMTTSFFFSRTVKLKPAHAVQPVLAVGGEVVPEDDLQEFVRG